ncbi:MAG: hypothetical protein MRZ37_04635 [Tenericutes bacterium]|nr:hypothetical protein [Mycoplasmatota bacterium]
MNNLRSFLNKNDLSLNRLTIKNKTKILDTNRGTLVLKKKDNNINLTNTFNYLESRAFNNYAKRVFENNNYDVYEYINGYNEPNEQKILDLINLLTILHYKTTFYKEVDIDYFKEIYENTINKIEYIYNYYTDIISLIETSIYMSPVEYLIARNISKIYESLNYSKENINKWYELVKDKRRIRVVNIHNNLSLEHYIKSDKPYLISWEKSKIDNPIYDLYNLYLNHYLDFDFNELFINYESKYPLLNEERILLFSLLTIPWKFEFNDTEYNLCKNARKLFDYLYKTEKLVTEYKYQKPNME